LETTVTGALTVSVVVPAMLVAGSVAVIVVEPMATDEAKPLEPPVLLMVATDAADELQVTDAVKFSVVLSVYVPVAVHCCKMPLTILGLAGVTAMETSVGAVTVSVVVPCTLVAGSVAVIVVEPVATDVAMPAEAPALLMVATDGADELQVTDAVRFCVVLFEYVPVAVNCFVVPLAMLGLAGVTAMETSVDAVTVSVVVACRPVAGSVAVIVVEPAVSAVASPLEALALLIVATATVDELQVTDAVRSCVVLSVYVPVAVNCFVNPVTVPGVIGVTAMDTSVAGVTVSVVVPDMPVAGSVAVIVVEPVASDVANPRVLLV
jgi:hypothetical protein